MMAEQHSLENKEGIASALKKKSSKLRVRVMSQAERGINQNGEPVYSSLHLKLPNYGRNRVIKMSQNDVVSSEPRLFTENSIGQPNVNTELSLGRETVVSDGNVAQAAE